MDEDAGFQLLLQNQLDQTAVSPFLLQHEQYQNTLSCVLNQQENISLLWPDVFRDEMMQVEPKRDSKLICLEQKLEIKEWQ